jgi:hypothetical protein
MIRTGGGIGDLVSIPLELLGFLARSVPHCNGVPSPLNPGPLAGEVLLKLG